MKVPARAKTLLALVEEYGWRYGAELGVWDGRTSEYLLSNAPELYLIGVDVWQSFDVGPKDKITGVSGLKTPEQIAAAREDAYRIKRRYRSRFHIIQDLTTSACESVEDSSLDFIFVDASHKTDDVIADVYAWAPKVKAGGMILGHDANWLSIQRALVHLGFNDHEILPGNVWLKKDWAACLR